MKEIEKSIKEVEGMYLSRNLQVIAEKAGRMIVVANYVCDLNDVIAKKDSSGEFQVAKELKNASDWRLFQELTAQADAIITGAGYLKRFAALKEKAEDVIDQFSEKGSFADLGKWREQHGLKRNPDIIIVSRSLDFDIPTAAFKGDRKVLVFTTFGGIASSKAKEFEKLGALVIAAGKDGVDGKTMTDYLAGKMRYKVVKMTTGPRVLSILLQADEGKGVLDELYITQVQRKIEASPADVQTILPNGEKVKDLPGFTLTHSFLQNNVTTDDGSVVSQKFLIYDKNDFLKLL